MKALVSDNENSIKLIDISEPTLHQPDEVKIRVNYATICQDDFHMTEERHIFGKYRMLGHEMAGELVELGPAAEAEGYQIGDRVTCMLVDFCGKCRHCRAGQQQYCVDGEMSFGTMTKYIVKKSRQLILLPEEVSYKQASLAEPVGTALETLAKVHPGFQDRVAVLGGEFTGQIYVRLLRLRGVEQITVLAAQPEQRELAKGSGAQWCLDPKDQNLDLQLSKITDYGGFDYIFATSPDIATVNHMVDFVAKGGCLVVTTVFDMSEQLAVNTLNLYLGNTTIVSSALCGSLRMAEALQVIPRIRADSFITAEFALQGAEAAFRLFGEGKHLKIGIRVAP